MLIKADVGEVDASAGVSSDAPCFVSLVGRCQHGYGSAK